LTRKIVLELSCLKGLSSLNINGLDTYVTMTPIKRRRLAGYDLNL